MTNEEKKALQLMAAKYEKYGVSFMELLRLFGQAPKDKPFIENYKAINTMLKKKYETPIQEGEKS